MFIFTALLEIPLLNDDLTRNFFILSRLHNSYSYVFCLYYKRYVGIPFDIRIIIFNLVFVINVELKLLVHIFKIFYEYLIATDVIENLLILFKHLRR